LPKKFQLPYTPRVISRDHCVFICFKDGSEIFWGEEESTIDALNVARELEIELQAVSYLKKQIKDFIEDISELLYSIGADESLLASIVKDGHSQALNEINSKTHRKLLLDRKPSLKQVIMDKIEIQYVI
jgi:hypothetical protein